MFLSPFDFGDASGLALLLVGLGAAAYATFKGYSAFDDTIPHYGKKYKKILELRAKISAEEKYNHSYREGGLYKPLADALLEARQRIAALFENERKKLDGLRSIEAKMVADVQSLTQSLSIWSNTCIAAVHGYRAENRVARRAALARKSKTTFWRRLKNKLFGSDTALDIATLEVIAQPPKYFDETVTFPTPMVQKFEGMKCIIEEAEEVVSGYPSQEAAALNAIDRLIEQLSTTFSETNKSPDIQASEQHVEL